MNRFVISIGIISFACFTYAQEVKQISSNTTNTYDDSYDMAKAKAEMLAAARVNAFDKSLGKNTNISSIVKDLFISRSNIYDEAGALLAYSSSSMASYFTDERIETLRSICDEYRYNLSLKYGVGIKPHITGRNPYLSMSVQFSSTSVKENQDYSISITPTVGGFLYIYRFLPDGEVRLCYPPKFATDNYIESETLKEINLKAETMPQNLTNAVETLYIVYTTVENKSWDKFRKSLFDDQSGDYIIRAGNDSFTIFQKWLSRFRSDHYIERFAQIRIEKQ